jgi:uncharacterized membrane protein YphA (DoxX/SURF4 family)
VLKLVSAYPTGLPSVGLILLRTTVATGAIAQSIGALSAPNQPTLGEQAIGVATIAVALVLLVGFLTPLSASIVTLGRLGVGLPSFFSSDAVPHSSSFTNLTLAAIAAALVFLGPGAASLDARLFGRREIVIPEDRRAREE